MKVLNELKTTDNPTVYKKARKLYLEQKGEISCSYCPYHRYENGHKYQRTWKKRGKNKHAWEQKEYESKPYAVTKWD